tara:strand:- start:414 stop:665 length:252 start_codon:yes stop_codon:yes gene_type:complete
MISCVIMALPPNHGAVMGIGEGMRVCLGPGQLGNAEPLKLANDRGIAAIDRFSGINRPAARRCMNANVCHLVSFRVSPGSDPA